MNQDEPHILILGAAASLTGRLIENIQKKHPHAHIIAVDSRPLKYTLKNVTNLSIQYKKSEFERIFRDYPIDIFYHIGRISHVSSSISKRLNLNILNTGYLLDLCEKYSIQKVLLLSTFHVYGALATNPVYIKEDSLLQASIQHSSLRDVVEMDQMATSWMWKNRGKIDCLVFRPTNIIGPNSNNTISKYLRARYAPFPMDFDPLFQFIHEDDVANILELALGEVPSGVYNIASQETISLKKARALLDIPTTTIPVSLFEGILKKRPFSKFFPPYLIDYIKYSTTIDGTSLQSELKENIYRISIQDSIKSLLD